MVLFLSMMAKYMPDMMYGIPKAARLYRKDLKNMTHVWSKGAMWSIVIHVYIPAIEAISARAHKV